MWSSRFKFTSQKSFVRSSWSLCSLWLNLSLQLTATINAYELLHNYELHHKAHKGHKEHLGLAISSDKNKNYLIFGTLAALDGLHPLEYLLHCVFIALRELER
jgi:hypothetical protein